MHKLVLKKIYPDELEAFIKGVEYKNFQTKPISPERAYSYFHNPRKIPNKAVLFMAFIENELVGFRTVLQDAIYVSDQKISCIWLSGSWVNKKHRRKGIGLWLLKHVFDEYDHKVLFTNYAPESLKLYLKSERFYRRDIRLGRRFILNPKFSHWIGKKWALLKILLLPIDALLKILYYPFWKTLPETNCNFVALKNFGEAEENFLHPFREKSLCKRGLAEFEWAIKYPWIVRSAEPLNYPFSRISPNYQSQWWQVIDENQYKALFLVNTRNGILKVPYLFTHDADTANQIAIFILKLAHKLNLTEIEVYHKMLITSIKRLFPLLLRKRKSLPVYVSKSLDLPNVGEFWIGDGEMIFL